MTTFSETRLAALTWTAECLRTSGIELDPDDCAKTWISDDGPFRREVEELAGRGDLDGLASLVGTISAFKGLHSTVREHHGNLKVAAPAVEGALAGLREAIAALPWETVFTPKLSAMADELDPIAVLWKAAARSPPRRQKDGRPKENADFDFAVVLLARAYTIMTGKGPTISSKPFINWMEDVLARIPTAERGWLPTPSARKRAARRALGGQ